MRLTFSLAVSMACFAWPAKTHEFWIDPLEFTVEPSGAVVADLRVGTEFEGSSQSYIPRNFDRFFVVQNGAAAKVPGTVGDRPAMNFPAQEEGLMVVVHQTTDQVVTWDTWQKFENFVLHKDSAWVLDEHLAKDMPEEGVREVYSRYAKSLIAVGEGAGKDIVSGMLTEIIALENPYTDNMDDGITVGVLYQGKPRKVTQIEVFERAPDGAVSIFTQKTDGRGVATIPVKPGHKYMLDSVVLRLTDKKTTNGPQFHWESLWANMTFEVPSQ